MQIELIPKIYESLCKGI